MYILLLTGLLLGCEEKTQDSALPEEAIEPQLCPNAVYPVLLQVWSDNDSDNKADTTPFCEAPFEVELIDGGGLHSEGDCEFQGGQQTRVLAYVFDGLVNEEGAYNGEVTLTKRNGDEQQDSFSGNCNEDSGTATISLEWTMTVSTPNGENHHRGSMATEE